MTKKKKEIEVTLNEYNFVVNKKAKVEVHRDEYEIEVSSMHGDADHYSTNSSFFSKQDEGKMKELFMWLSFFDHLKELKWPDRDTIDELLRQYVHAYHKEIGNPLDEDDYCWDSISELVDRDMTSDGEYMCKPDLVAVYYHDTYGVKQEVKFKKK